MCGIVGLMGYGATGLSLGDLDMFRHMLYADAIRGMHGTGMFAIDSRGNMNRIRVGGPPSQLFATKEYGETEEFVGRREIRFLVGHNRWATKGAKTTAHSHPFRDGHIILVHNGTLEDYKHLPDAEKYAVDSELLTHAIAVNGVEETIKSLVGAWTIVYWDGKSKTLNILRNSERPLYLAWHDTYKMFAFASEEGMLEWILQRNHMFSHVTKEVPENTLLSFGLEDPIPKETELKGKSFPKKDKNQAYYEGIFKDAADACSTTESCTRDVDIAPLPVKLAAPSGEWNRGATGRVLMIPDKRHKHSKKSDPGKLAWQPVEHLHNLNRGDWVTVKIVNYDLLRDSKTHFQIQGQSDDHPDIDFYCNVRGEDTVDVLTKATFGMRGQISTIQKSMHPTAVCAHRIYLHNPEPAWVEEPADIPEHAHQTTH